MKRILLTPDGQEGTTPPVLTPEEKAAQIGAALGNFSALAGTIASLAAPQFVPMVAAFGAVLKFAPELYVDFVSMFSKGEPTDADKADFNAKLKVLLNPEAAYQDPPAPASPS